MRTSALNYRPDIDGLRAVAIIAVIAFHAFPNQLNGGFIGVDVFFVISGYLISGIIFSELATSRFSFLKFYARRIKRLFPALLVVLISCYIFGWLSLFPNEYKELAKYTASGATFISNLVLWRDAGYFDSSADTKPLLHLWSLGIEEQFYIFWPITLWLLWKNKLGIFKITLTICLISFLLNIYQTNQNSIVSFYQPLTRFWEFLFGSILASSFGLIFPKNGSALHHQKKLQKLFPRTLARWLVNTASLSGFLFLTFGFAIINTASNFPGFWALLPVLGATLLLTAGPDGWINKHLLSNRLMVGVGLISYPLYLWHWPILSFAYILESGEPNILIRCGAIILSIGLSWLTYCFIERPIRQNNTKRLISPLLALGVFIIGGVGYFTYINNGFENRDTSLPTNDFATTAIENCKHQFPEWSSQAGIDCKFQKVSKNTIAVIGDSHADHLFLGLSQLIDSKEGVISLAASCAAPFIDISSPISRDPNSKKSALINSAFDYVLSDPNIHTVLLAHNPSCSYGDAKDLKNPSLNDADKILTNGMLRTFSALEMANKHVVVLLDNPNLPYDPEKCVNRPLRITNSIEDNCKFLKIDFESRNAWPKYKKLVFSAAAGFPFVSIYDLSDPLCDGKYCYLVKSGHLLYQDRGHFNKNGSVFIAPYIIEKINATSK